MKISLKNLLAKNNLILIVIFLSAGLIRLYNFPDRVTFWTEQARSLIVSGSYINEKLSLLGQEYFRQDSNGHVIYSGALFNYTLVPLMLLFKYDPVRITLFFSILNLFTGYMVFVITKKLFGYGVAILASFLFLFNFLMIYHSFFIWNYNYLPLIGILIFYLIYQKAKISRRSIFLIGLLCGVGISLQILFVLFTLAISVIVIARCNKKDPAALIFFIGIILGNLPMVLFDLRHDFYQTKTIVQYFLDTISGTSDAGFAYYYFLPLIPILTVLTAFIFLKIFNFNKFLFFAVIAIYLYLNLTSSYINWKSPTGMPDGLTVKTLDNITGIIAKDAKDNFNISEVLDFDKRAYMLRYFLEYKYHKKPVDELNFNNINLLYVLAGKDYNFRTSDVWEVKSSGLTHISKIVDIGENYAIFRLTQ